jgi:hypothetical protein
VYLIRAETDEAEGKKKIKYIGVTAENTIVVLELLIVSKEEGKSINTACSRPLMRHERHAGNLRLRK